MLDYLVEDEAHQGDLPVPGGDRRPGRGSPRAAARADRAGKPIVALKAGSSPAGQQAALAHTGSVAGRRRRRRRGAAPAQRDPGDQHRGTADHRRAARLRPLAGRPADGRADRLGRRVRHHRRPGQRRRASRFRRSRRRPPRRSRRTLPPFASARNPLDVTGYGLANQRHVGADRDRPRAGRGGRRPGAGLRAVLRASTCPTCGRRTRRPRSWTSSGSPGWTSASPRRRSRSSRSARPASTSAPTAASCWAATTCTCSAE